MPAPRTSFTKCTGWPKALHGLRRNHHQRLPGKSIWLGTPYAIVFKQQSANSRAHIFIAQ